MNLSFLKTNRNKRYLWAFLLSLPALVGLVLFHFWPIFETIRIGLSDYNIYTQQLEWKGVENYQIALQDKALQNSVLTTLKYFVLQVPIQMVMALGLALLVSQPGKGVGLLRTVILLPPVTSMVVASTVWGMMYHPNNGLINSILQSVGLPAQPFLTSANQALPAIATIAIWKDVGLYMLFFLAGLMNIPDEYYDAAKVDGANSWQILRFITVPLLQRTTIFVLIVSTISAFKVFVPVKILTGGGPFSSTRVIVLYIFDLAFKFNRFGYATAIGVLLALTLLVISIIQFRLSREQ
jgi:ABC-type sugar transport system permease subunit